jgi:hypothetical protein
MLMSSWYAYDEPLHNISCCFEFNVSYAHVMCIVVVVVWCGVVWCGGGVVWCGVVWWCCVVVVLWCGVVCGVVFQI